LNVEALLLEVEAHLVAVELQVRLIELFILDLLVMSQDVVLRALNND